MKGKGGVEAAWARPAGWVLLSSCTQLAQHRLLEHWDRLQSLQGESQEQGLPSGPAAAAWVPLLFLDRLSVKNNCSQPHFSLSLNADVLSCHVTQVLAPDTALSKLWPPEGPRMLMPRKDPSSSLGQLCDLGEPEPL